MTKMEGNDILQTIPDNRPLCIVPHYKSMNSVLWHRMEELLTSLPVHSQEKVPPIDGTGNQNSQDARVMGLICVYWDL